MPAIDKAQQAPSQAAALPMLLQASQGVAADPSAMGGAMPQGGTPVPNWMHNVLSAADQASTFGMPGMRGAGPPADPRAELMIPLMMLGMAAEPGPDILGPIVKRISQMLPDGRLAGIALENAPTKQGPEPADVPIKVYHGSPHRFAEFRDDAIGTGEGAQAYGYGHYLSENNRVAKWYRDKLSRNRSVHDPELLKEYFKPGNIVPSYGGKQRVISFNEDATGWSVTAEPMRLDGVGNWVKDTAYNYPVSHHTAPSADDYTSVTGTKPFGAMYEVGIKAKPEHFLDHDLPMTQQTPEVKAMVDAIPGLAEALPDWDMLKHFKPSQMGGWTGRDFYDALSRIPAHQLDPDSEIGPEAASKLLNAVGIPGIRYLDQFSRVSEEGTSNFVVFSDTTLEVLKRYGLAGLIAGGAVASQASRPAYAEHKPSTPR